MERLKKLEKDQKDEITLLQQGNSTYESELKDKKKSLEEEQKKIEELNRKIKASKLSLDELESGGSNKSSTLNKLKEENINLESHYHSLQERVEDAEKKIKWFRNKL